MAKKSFPPVTIISGNSSRDSRYVVRIGSKTYRTQRDLSPYQGRKLRTKLRNGARRKAVEFMQNFDLVPLDTRTPSSREKDLDSIIVRKIQQIKHGMDEETLEERFRGWKISYWNEARVDEPNNTSVPTVIGVLKKRNKTRPVFHYDKQRNKVDTLMKSLKRTRPEPFRGDYREKLDDPGVKFYVLTKRRIVPVVYNPDHDKFYIGSPRLGKPAPKRPIGTGTLADYDTKTEKPKAGWYFLSRETPKSGSAGYKVYFGPVKDRDLAFHLNAFQRGNYAEAEIGVVRLSAEQVKAIDEDPTAFSSVPVYLHKPSDALYTNYRTGGGISYAKARNLSKAMLAKEKERLGPFSWRPTLPKKPHDPKKEREEYMKSYLANIRQNVRGQQEERTMDVDKVSQSLMESKGNIVGAGGLIDEKKKEKVNPETVKSDVKDMTKLAKDAHKHGDKSSLKDILGALVVAKSLLKALS